MKSLTKILLAAVLVASTCLAFAKPYTAKTNVADVVDRHLSGFNGVNVAGPFDVYITQGSSESVKVEAPADVMDHIITDVKDGVLRIYNKHESFSWGNWFGHKKIAVYVTAKDLNMINISGSGDVFFKEGVSTNSLKLKISGSGDMVGKVNVKTLESSITGSGDMKLTGSAQTSTISVVGSGDFIAKNLVTVSTSVKVSGSGDADVNASESINAAVHGSGDIRYAGGAKNVRHSKTGSGDIRGY
jgi:hypothetical protein